MFKLNFSFILLFSFIFINLSFADNLICFSPKGNCEQSIIEVIDNTKFKIDLAIFSFTSKNISNALINAKSRNVKIRIIMETDQISKYSKYKNLLAVSIPVKVDGKSGYMHNKYLISDEKIIITGSYNYSANAEFNNFENLLVIDNPNLAKIYSENFEDMWKKF